MCCRFASRKGPRRRLVGSLVCVMSLGIRGVRLTVDCDVYSVRAGSTDHFSSFCVEVFEMRHGEVIIVQSGLIQKFDGCYCTTVHVLRKLRGKVPEHVQTPVCIRRVAGEQDGPNEATVVLSVLGSWCAVEVDHDLQARLVSPLYRLDKIRVLSIHVRLIIADVNSPVADGNADCIKASRCHVLKVISGDEVVPVSF